MTAGQFARLLNARRTGRGRWQARCPAHVDKRPSLSISEGKTTPVVFKCMSAGCTQDEVLSSMGLTWKDVLGEPTPQVRARTSLYEQRESLERELGLAMWLGALGPGWGPLVQKLRKDLLLVRCQIEPLTVYREWRVEQWRLMNRTQRERALEQAYERFSNSGNESQ